MKPSGLADSPFFSQPAKPTGKAPTPQPEKPAKKKTGKVVTVKKEASTKKPPDNRDTMQSRNHATTVSRYHAAMIEAVRKAVKEFGKEAATHRFTAEEKQKLADIVYSYKRRGIRTSENEVTRIAINFLIDDHAENGENSLLDLTLKALNL
jgi:hypothetical protein